MTNQSAKVPKGGRCTVYHFSREGKDSLTWKTCPEKGILAGQISLWELLIPEGGASL
jgi:hypothetical protein